MAETVQEADIHQGHDAKVNRMAVAFKSEASTRHCHHCHCGNQRLCLCQLDVSRALGYSRWVSRKAHPGQESITRNQICYY